MNRSTLADTMCEAILKALDEFRQLHPSENPYAFTLVSSSAGDWIGYAVATDQGLHRVAEKYDNLGYRYQAHEWEQFDNLEKLATWLRWANPDDGWVSGDLPERSGVEAALRRCIESGDFGENGEEFEEFCVDVLASLQAMSAWHERNRLTGERPITVGFTYGEDPRDFLRTATRANPYPLVQRLWAEVWAGDEIELRIKRTR